MELLVLSLLVFQITQSPFQIALILVFNNAARPLVSPFTGLIADRFSRRRTLMAAQAINTTTAGTLLTLIMLDSISPWQIFSAATLLGVTKALEDPARRTGILDIVGEGRIVNAMSLEVITNTTGRMIGPVGAGLLIDSLGYNGAYQCLLGIHTANLLVMLTRVRIPMVQRQISPEPLVQSLKEAVRYAINSPMLLGLLYVTIVMNAMAFPVRQFIPVIGLNHLHVGAALVGLLVASESFGQLAGAVAMALTRNLNYLGRVLVIGSLVVLVSAVLFPWSTWYGLAFGLLLIGGIGQAGFSTMQSTIAMTAAPTEMRGRTLGLLSFCIGVSTPLGTLEMGAIATLSTQWAISGNALAGLVLLLPVVWLAPLVWKPVVQIPPAR